MTFLSSVCETSCTLTTPPGTVKLRTVSTATVMCSIPFHSIHAWRVAIENEQTYTSPSTMTVINIEGLLTRLWSFDLALHAEGFHGGLSHTNLHTHVNQRTQQ